MSDFTFRRQAGLAWCVGAVLSSCGEHADESTPGQPAKADVASTPSLPANSPHVVLILIDTLRQDRLGCYGYEHNTTPEIDRLALDSARFTHAIAQAPWTTPSMASMLTSRDPAELGIGDRPVRLPDEAPYLPEMLQDHGYDTVAILSNPMVGAQWNFHRGFRLFDQEHLIRTSHDVSSPGVSDNALRYLEERPDSPFFLWLHYFDPHADYRSHRGFGVHDPDASAEEIAFREYRQSHRNGTLTADDVEHASQLYDSDVRFTDHHVGRFLDGLRENGLYDESLIILTSDHGEEFFDHGGIGHVTSLHRELVTVPLLIKWPHQTEPSTHDHPVALIDLFPTILAHLDLPPLDEARGRSLWPPRDSTAETSRPIFMETMKGRELFGVVDGDYKAIFDVQRRDAQVFLVRGDPWERRALDLTTANRKRKAKADVLIELLRDRVTESKDRIANAAAMIEPLTEEELARLRALGYADDVIEDAERDSDQR